MLQKMRNRKGFTLIELMIVIAITGILIAVAIPNFIAYRDRERNVELEIVTQEQEAKLNHKNVKQKPPVAKKPSGGFEKL